MPIHLRPLSNEIGVFTRSQARFLAIAKALNEPCVWLTQADTDDLQLSYEVVIIDALTAPVEPRPAARDATIAPTREQPPPADNAATWRQPGLVVYQCPDTTD